MTDMAIVRANLATAIDTIEGGYEFLLAYAAQGRNTDRDAAADQSPRARLEAMVKAMADLPGLTRTVADSIDAELVANCAAFLDALERDAAASAGAVRLVLHKQDLSSQLIDNLNASIHLRALLADVFLVDEAFK